jgi:hypothetical protein
MELDCMLPDCMLSDCMLSPCIPDCEEQPASIATAIAHTPNVVVFMSCPYALRIRWIAER